MTEAAAHPAQRFVDFICKKIDELIGSPAGFLKTFTVKLPKLNGGFYINVSMHGSARDHMNLATLAKAKKDSVVISVWDMYQNDKRWTKEQRDEIFGQGE